MRGLLLLLSCYFSLSCLGQVQKGFAVLQNSGKKGLSNVSINIDNAIPTTSDVNGEFAIEVPNHNPGNRLIVQDISHPKYLLVNKREVENWVYSPQKNYRIDFCPPDEYYSRVDNYYHIGNDNYKNELQKKLDELEELKRDAKLRQEDYAKKYQELYNNYNAQTRELGGYCEMLAAVNVDFLDTLELTAINYVDAGRIDLAISIYEHANLKEKYENAINQHRTINEELREAIPQLDRYFTILMLKGGDEQIENAGKILKLIADYDTLNEKRNREYIDFTIGHRKYDIALKYINRTLSYIKDPYTEIEYLLRKASILDERHEDDAVFGIYAKIDTIFASLPNDDLKYIAIQIIYQDYLGRLFYRRGLYNNAFLCYRKRVYYLANYLKDTDNRRNELKRCYYMMLDCTTEMDSLDKMEEVKTALDSLSIDSQDSILISLSRSLYYIKRQQFDKSLCELKKIENDVRACLEKDFYASIGLHMSFLSNLLASYAGTDSILEAERIIEEGDALLMDLSDIQKYELGGALAIYYTNKMYLRLSQKKYNDVIDLMDTCALYKQDTTKDLLMCQNWMAALIKADKDYKIMDLGYSKPVYIQTILHPQDKKANELFYQFCSVMNMAGYTSICRKFELERWRKIKSQRNDKIKLQCVLNIANSYFRDNKLDSTYYYLNKCEKFANKVRDTSDSIFSMLYDENVFNYYMASKQFKNAKKVFKKRQKMFPTAYLGYIRMQLCMALLENSNSSYWRDIQKGMHLLQENDSLHFVIADMEQNICNAISREIDKEFLEAIDFYNKAYKQCEKLCRTNPIRYCFWESYIIYKISHCSYEIDSYDLLWHSVELSILNYKNWSSHNKYNVSFLGNNINPITIMFKDDVTKFSDLMINCAQYNSFSACVADILLRAASKNDVNGLANLIASVSNREIPLLNGVLYKEDLPITLAKMKDVMNINNEVYDTIINILREL